MESVPVSGPATGFPDTPEPAAARARPALVLSALCTASFLASLNFFAPTPFFPDIADDLHTTIPLLGQVTTLTIIVSAFLGLLIGPLADRYGYRWPLVIGVIAIAINLTGIGLAPAYAVMLLVAVAGGLGDAMAFGLPLAIAGIHFDGDAKRKAVSWIIAALALSPIIGTPILTNIGGFTGWRTAMVLAGGVSAVAALFIAYALPRDGLHPTTPLNIRRLLAGYTPLVHHPPTLRLLGFSALRATTWIGLITYLGAFLADDVGLSIRQIGLVYTIAGSSYALGSFIAGGRLMRDRPPRTVACLSSLIGAPIIGLALMFDRAVPVTGLLMCAAFLGALGNVVIVTLLEATSPIGMGTTMVLYGSLFNFGSALGALAGGVLIAFGGYQALGLGLPIFALVAAALVWSPGNAADVPPASPNPSPLGGRL